MQPNRNVTHSDGAVRIVFFSTLFALSIWQSEVSRLYVACFLLNCFLQKIRITLRFYLKKTFRTFNKSLYQALFPEKLGSFSLFSFNGNIICHMLMKFELLMFWEFFKIKTILQKAWIFYFSWCKLNTQRSRICLILQLASNVCSTLALARKIFVRKVFPKQVCGKLSKNFCDVENLWYGITQSGRSSKGMNRTVLFEPLGQINTVLDQKKAVFF